MISQPSPSGGKALRTVAIVLFAAAAAFNLLGGIGTSCVALNPTGWGASMAQLAPFQWLYIVLMLGAIVVSAWGIVVTVGLARSRRNAYRDALVVLLLSGILAAVQTYASIALRGKGAPQNIRYYFTTLVLVVFLLLRLPPVWRLINGFTSDDQGNWRMPTGLAAFVGGLIVLTTPLWATPTHIGPDGVNWVNVLRTPLLAGGALLTLVGAGLVRHAGGTARLQPAPQAAARS
ncbi:MAG: hypothetical protein ACUVR4_14175 [Anaerolineae bacterium]